MKKSKPKKSLSQLRVAIISVAVGAVLGSVLSFSLPILYDRLTESNVEETLDETPTELLLWYKTFGNKIRADRRVKEKYAGKYVEWEGTIEEVRSSFGGGYLFLPSFLAFFDGEESLLGLRKGDHVRVRGQLSDFSESVIVLKECEILEQEEGSPQSKDGLP